MRILLITLYFTPDDGPDPPLMAGLAKEWATAGHQVTVVAAFPHYKKNSLPTDYKGRLFQKETIDGYRVIRTWVYVPPNQKLAHRLLNYFSFMMATVLVGLLSGHYDIIVAYTPPPSNGIAAFCLSKLKKIPYIDYIQDIYPDVGIELGLFTNPRLIKLMQSVENFLYRHASRIVVISDLFRSRLVAKGVNSEKLVIVRNWVDTDFIKPMSGRAESLLGLRSESFVFLYAGNVGLSQGLETVLEAAQLLQQDRGDISFVIVGGGETFEKLQYWAKERGISNVVFRPYVPQKHLPELLASADVSLVSLKKGIAFNSVPSKLYSIMASGRPVLAIVDENSDTWNIVTAAKAGICIAPGDPVAIANACRELYDQPDLRKAYANNGRKYVEVYVSRQSSALKFVETFTLILS